MENFRRPGGELDTLGGMSFHDLPQDWPTRSLADPAFAADVLDLCVSDADRATGGLAVLLCRPDGALSQPLFVAQVPHEAGFREAVSAVVLGALSLPGVDGLVVALVRRRGALADADRRVHQHAIEVCRRAGLTLHGTFLVTAAGVGQLPVAAALRRSARDVA